MTSKPASLSALAITLAPRSCPSSPGLATRTLIFSEAAGFTVLSINASKGIADLLERGVSFDRFHQRLHQILSGLGRVDDVPDAVGVSFLRPLLSQLGQALDLPLLDRTVDVECVDRALRFLLLVLVDADHDFVFRLELALEVVGGVRDLGL